MPLSFNAAMALAALSSTCRLTHTKVLSSFSSFLFNSASGMPSSFASGLSLAGSRSTSSGMAQMLGAGTLLASSRPLRSRIRPRLAGSSSVRAKRTSPCFWKNALPNTWIQAARPARPRKPSAMPATISLLRQTGVLLASSGDDV
jgi:hypothetical protein